MGRLQPSFVMDGESIGDVFHAFYLLELDGADLRELPYRDRLERLQSLVGGGTEAIAVARTAVGAKEKRKLMAELKAANKEGIVFKSLSAHWYAGRPENGGSALKCKFWSSASCVVSKVNAKRSIEVSLDGKSIGNVTIPPNKDIPEVGQVVEIKYLYVVGVGGKLYQPIYLGPRDDVDASECTVAGQRIKYKPETED